MKASRTWVWILLDSINKLRNNIDAHTFHHFVITLNSIHSGHYIRWDFGVGELRHPFEDLIRLNRHKSRNDREALEDARLMVS